MFNILFRKKSKELRELRYKISLLEDHIHEIVEEKEYFRDKSNKLSKQMNEIEDHVHRYGKISNESLNFIVSSHNRNSVEDLDGSNNSEHKLLLQTPYETVKKNIKRIVDSINEMRENQNAENNFS